jgi:predicted nucleic acid-binding protein
LRVFLDTTVLVASAVGRHPHHPRAASVVEAVLAGRDEGIIAAHGIAEAYAVLTTLPVTPRIGPETADRIIHDNFIAHLAVVALTAREYARVVSALAERGAIGGAIYDAVQLASARKARADRIYTFNVKDFRRLDPTGADLIVAP